MKNVMKSLFALSLIFMTVGAFAQSTTATCKKTCSPAQCAELVKQGKCTPQQVAQCMTTTNACTPKSTKVASAEVTRDAGKMEAKCAPAASCVKVASSAKAENTTAVLTQFVTSIEPQKTCVTVKHQ